MVSMKICLSLILIDNFGLSSLTRVCKREMHSVNTISLAKSDKATCLKLLFYVNIKRSFTLFHLVGPSRCFCVLVF